MAKKKIKEVKELKNVDLSDEDIVKINKYVREF